jgi:hypothetical protein
MQRLANVGIGKQTPRRGQFFPGHIRPTHRHVASHRLTAEDGPDLRVGRGCRCRLADLQQLERKFRVTPTSSAAHRPGGEHPETNSRSRLCTSGLASACNSCSLVLAVAASGSLVARPPTACCKDSSCGRVCSYIRTSAIPTRRGGSANTRRTAKGSGCPEIGAPNSRAPRSRAACGVPCLRPPPPLARGHVHHKPDHQTARNPEAVSNPHQHVIGLDLSTFQNFHGLRLIHSHQHGQFSLAHAAIHQKPESNANIPRCAGLSHYLWHLLRIHY